MKPRSAHGAHTLPARHYLSAELFAREMERIFARSWLYAGRLSEIPGPAGYLRRDVGADSLLVVRDGEAPPRAFHNVCRHRGTRLCRAASGRLPRAIQCPYHAWTWELDGRLRAAPNMGEVEGFRLDDHPLAEAEAGVWAGFVFVRVESGGPSLEEHLAPFAGRLDAWRLPELMAAHRTSYEVAANWKLLFQNYSECYHCPTAHPQLERLTPYRDSENDLEEGPLLGGPMRLADPAGSMTTHGGRCAPPLGGAEGDGGERGRVFYYTRFPDLFLSLHPEYVLAHRLEPLAPGSTRVTCDWLFAPEAVAADGFDPAPAVEFWDTTNRQDWELCEGVQLGVASRAYRPGPYAELESQLAAFDREYLRAMGGEGGDSPPR